MSECDSSKICADVEIYRTDIKMFKQETAIAIEL